MAGYVFECRQCQAKLRMKTFQPGAKFSCPACKTVTVLGKQPPASKFRQEKNPFADERKNDSFPEEDWGDDRPARRGGRANAESGLDGATMWAIGITLAGLIGMLLPFAFRSVGMFSLTSMVAELVLTGLLFGTGVLMLTVSLGNTYGPLAALGTLGGGGFVALCVIVAAAIALVEPAPPKIAAAPQNAAVQPAPQNPASPVKRPRIEIVNPNRPAPQEADAQMQQMRQQMERMGVRGQGVIPGSDPQPVVPPAPAVPQYPVTPPTELGFPYLPTAAVTISVPMTQGIPHAGELSDALLAIPGTEQVIFFTRGETMHFMVGPVSSVTTVQMSFHDGVPMTVNEERRQIEMQELRWATPPPRISTFHETALAGIPEGKVARAPVRNRGSRNGMPGLGPNPNPGVPTRLISEAFDNVRWSPVNADQEPVAYIAVSSFPAPELSARIREVRELTGINRVTAYPGSSYRFFRLGPVENPADLAKQLESLGVASVDEDRRLIILKSAQEAEERFLQQSK